MPTLEKAKKRGVKIRIAAPITSKNEQVAKDMSKVAEVRSLKNFNGRFSIIDGQNLMFMLLDDAEVHPSYDIGVWINTPYFAQSLEDMFELAWKSFPAVKGSLSKGKKK